MQKSVSIHAPVWGATTITNTLNLDQLFQSTHPCGVRQSASSHYRCSRRFNPRTRVGCDRARPRCWHDDMVSIHAPVWGATDGIKYPRTWDLVSIHAPVWGATRISHATQSSYHCFNPRTRVGCDAKNILIIILSKFQSTHPCGVRPQSSINLCSM